MDAATWTRSLGETFQEFQQLSNDTTYLQKVDVCKGACPQSMELQDHLDIKTEFNPKGTVETLTKEERELYIADIQRYIHEVPYKLQISVMVLHSKKKNCLTDYDDLVPFSQHLSDIGKGVRELVKTTVRIFFSLQQQMHVTMHLATHFVISITLSYLTGINKFLQYVSNVFTHEKW
jgi:hypothetical protein